MLSGDRVKHENVSIQTHLESEFIKFSSHGLQAIRDGHMRKEKWRNNMYESERMQLLPIQSVSRMK